MSFFHAITFTGMPDMTGDRTGLDLLDLAGFGIRFAAEYPSQATALRRRQNRSSHEGGRMPHRSPAVPKARSAI
jgi:hypothetical protein